MLKSKSSDGLLETYSSLIDSNIVAGRENNVNGDGVNGNVNATLTPKCIHIKVHFNDQVWDTFTIATDTTIGEFISLIFRNNLDLDVTCSTIFDQIKKYLFNYAGNRPLLPMNSIVLLEQISIKTDKNGKVSVPPEKVRIIQTVGKDIAFTSTFTSVNDPINMYIITSAGKHSIYEISYPLEAYEKNDRFPPCDNFFGQEPIFGTQIGSGDNSAQNMIIIEYVSTTTKVRKAYNKHVLLDNIMNHKEKREPTSNIQCSERFINELVTSEGYFEILKL